MLYNCNMQQLHQLTIRIGAAEGCAAEILETVPTVMRFIRAQMRRHRGPNLSVPQFRTLVFLSKHPDASLSSLAEFLGLSMPATSRLVEGLVRKSLVIRQTPAGNRRRVALSLSARGQRNIRAARQATERRLAEVVASLPNGKRVGIQRALRTLRKVFQPMAPRNGFGAVRP